VLGPPRQPLLGVGAAVGAERPRSMPSPLPNVAWIACDANKTDGRITMSSMDLARPRFLRLSRSQLRLNTKHHRLLAATHLGTGLGDTFKVSQGDSELFEGGICQADETGSCRENAVASAVPPSFSQSAKPPW
jgi:hypothetical protein